MVIPPAKTGNEITSSMAVTKIDQEKRAIWPSKYQNLMFIIVVIKLMAPKREDKRAKWRLKIKKSTALCGVPKRLDRGG